MAPEEPKKPYQQNGQPCDHFGRSGVGALAHSIGNGDNKSWGYLSDLMATGCAKSYKGLLDGHASTHMHVLWGSLGAAMADEKDFREYLDYIKWWMIMAQTHDGGFVVMPGRDYASTDHVYGDPQLPHRLCRADSLAQGKAPADHRRAAPVGRRNGAGNHRHRRPQRAQGARARPRKPLPAR